MEPIVVIVSSAFLISLCIVFLSLWQGFLSGGQAASASSDQRDTTAKPILVTASGVVFIGIFVFSLFIGNEVLALDGSLNRAAVQARSEVASLSSAEDLERLADAVDKAAASIYSGLETTQDFIGKTEARKKAIAYGRSHASDRLGSLSQRIRNASAQNEPLRLFDRRVAEHITAGLI